MSNQGDARGTGTTPPPWWLELFASARAQRREENVDAKKAGRTQPHVEDLVGLGEVLGQIAGRGSWNHGAVSNFINGSKYTREMAAAFSELYDIPMFEHVIRAETLDEALRIRTFLRGLKRPAAAGVNPETPKRLEKLDKAAHGLNRQQEDQRVQVPSKNEAGKGRGSRRTSGSG